MGIRRRKGAAQVAIGCSGPAIPRPPAQCRPRCRRSWASAQLV